MVRFLKLMWFLNIMKKQVFGGGMPILKVQKIVNTEWVFFNISVRNSTRKTFDVGLQVFLTISV